MSNFKYGHIFHEHKDTRLYKSEWLEAWTDRELLLKHYYFTMALDDYKHLSEPPSTLAICLTFRESLRRRGIDGVQHCLRMEWMYDCGYRTVQIFFPPTS